MTERTKNQVAEEESSVQKDLFKGENATVETEGQAEQETKPLTATDIRNASYFILTIGAIFVINAMETGSYRTPWPVAVVVSLAGFGLLAYSFVKEKRERTEI